MKTLRPSPADQQLKTLLSRNDWADILKLLEKKTYQRKFQIIETFVAMVAELGIHHTSHVAIAKKCGITRQLVDHHFPDDSSLVNLSYRYIYAGFQKRAADGLISKESFSNQLKGYIDSVASWIEEKRAHARFLVQYYAILQTDKTLASGQERNLQIGRERLVSLCVSARKEGHFLNVSELDLAAKANNMQTQILGFIAMHAWKTKGSLTEAMKQELRRSCFALLDVRVR